MFTYLLESPIKKAETDEQKWFPCEEIRLDPSENDLSEDDMNIVKIGEHDIKYLNTNFLKTQEFSE